MFKSEIDYIARYNTFKKIPQILMICTIVIFVIIGLCDAIICFTDMEPFFAFIMWAVIGVVLGLLTKFFSAVFISPIVIITDTKIDQDGK